jgi:hypothetical protein
MSGERGEERRIYLKSDDDLVDSNVCLCAVCSSVKGKCRCNASTRENLIGAGCFLNQESGEDSRSFDLYIVNNGNVDGYQLKRMDSAESAKHRFDTEVVRSMIRSGRASPQEFYSRRKASGSSGRDERNDMTRNKESAQPIILEVSEISTSYNACLEKMKSEEELNTPRKEKKDEEHGHENGDRGRLEFVRDASTSSVQSLNFPELAEGHATPNNTEVTIPVVTLAEFVAGKAGNRMSAPPVITTGTGRESEIQLSSDEADQSVIEFSETMPDVPIQVEIVDLNCPAEAQEPEEAVFDEAVSRNVLEKAKEIEAGRLREEPKVIPSRVLQECFKEAAPKGGGGSVILPEGELEEVPSEVLGALLEGAAKEGMKKTSPEILGIAPRGEKPAAAIPEILGGLLEGSRDEEEALLKVPASCLKEGSPEAKGEVKVVPPEMLEAVLEGAVPNGKERPRVAPPEMPGVRPEEAPAKDGRLVPPGVIEVLVNDGLLDAHPQEESTVEEDISTSSDKSKAEGGVHEERDKEYLDREFKKAACDLAPETESSAVKEPRPNKAEINKIKKALDGLAIEEAPEASDAGHGSRSEADLKAGSSAAQGLASGTAHGIPGGEEEKANLRSGREDSGSTTILFIEPDSKGSLQATRRRKSSVGKLVEYFENMKKDEKK